MIVTQGEWWRAITALTLHADLSHVAANIASGLLFAGFALGQFGAGVTWLSIVAAGILGNLMNAWFYRSEPHLSIGASTAVFGALGMLVGAELLTRIRSSHKRGLWHIIVPIGAGLGLLAFLGAGDEQKQTDYMAHWWGFVAGCAIGGILAALRIKERAGKHLQYWCGGLAGGLLVIGWWLALA